MVSYWQIFWVFAKIGAFTIGGGIPMIAAIKSELVERKWLKDEDFLDIITLAQLFHSLCGISKLGRPQIGDRYYSYQRTKKEARALGFLLFFAGFVQYFAVRHSVFYFHNLSYLYFIICFSTVKQAKTPLVNDIPRIF